jgi:hypothetical protein
VRRGLGGSTLTTLALLALVGCTPTATEYETPEIVWITDGTSPLESDPWLQAARAQDLGTRLAYNTHDFTIPQLTSTRTDGSIDSLYDYFVTRFVDREDPPIAYPGPAVWLPLAVEESDDGSRAVVRVCAASDSWLLTADGETPFDITEGHELELEVANDPKSGKVLVLSRAELLTECDATGAPVGRFEPKPDVPERLTESEVRAPLG